MTRYISILFALLFSAAALRADLVLVQQASDTNRTQLFTLKLHGDRMRMDVGLSGFGVIADLNTHDSFTLLTNKTYLKRPGDQLLRILNAEKRATHGTNDLDWPAAPAVDTGKSEIVNGYDAEIYTWSGARGVMETLWVAKKFPNYDAIRPELAKLDQFNDSGPHRNAQPKSSLLPGMVIKSESLLNGHRATITLISVNTEPLDPALFQLPVDYTPWKPEAKKP